MKLCGHGIQARLEKPPYQGRGYIKRGKAALRFPGIRRLRGRGEAARLSDQFPPREAAVHGRAVRQPVREGSRTRVKGQRPARGFGGAGCDLVVSQATG